MTLSMAAKTVFFVIGTLVIGWVSRQNLLHVRQHGFYRFLAWETILIAFILNVDYWFVDPLSFPQLTAWFLLVISLALIIIAVRAFQRLGDIDDERMDPGLVGIEKTTQLVTTGIYRYIRHPFYSSLLFLSWGIFFKQVTFISLLLALLTTTFLFITSKIEEVENIAYFGQPYRDYMQTTRMFIPYVI